MTNYIVTCTYHNEDDDSITTKTWNTDEETIGHIADLLGEPAVHGMHPSLHAAAEDPDMIIYTKEQ